MNARTIAHIYSMLEEEYEQTKAVRDLQDDTYADLLRAVESGNAEEAEAAKKRLPDAKAKYRAAEDAFKKARDIFSDFDYQDWHFAPEG